MGYGLRHGGGDFAQQGVGHHNADGPQNDIRPAAAHHHGVLAGGSAVSPGFQHGGSGRAVGADGRYHRLGNGLFNGGNQLAAQPAALSVNHKNFHKRIPLSLSLFYHHRIMVFCCCQTVESNKKIECEEFES